MAASRLLLALLMLVCLPQEFATSAEPASPDPTIVILFDSSGSMWGSLPGGQQAKYAVARDALRQSLPALDVRARMGLITFGRGCSGVDVVLPPDVRPQDRTIAPLNALNPRGKGPLGAALLRAAEQVETGRRASLIVIHDGPDNCRQDTCAVARDIAASHPGMPIHLVSLGLDEVAANAVACIAKETGGQIFSARSTLEVAPAIDQAIKLAMTSPVPAPKPAEQPDPASKREKLQVPADGPPHLLVSATLGPSLPVDKPVHWQIFRSGEDTPVLDVLEAQFAVPLPSGSYVIQATLGRAQARQVVEVAEKGPTLATVAFSAGIARITTRFGSNEAAELPVLVSVAAIDEAATTAAAPGLTPVIAIPSRSSELVLPAGTYRITATSGLSSATRDVDIAPAEIENVTLDLKAGQLHLGAIPSAGATLLSELTYVLSVDDPAAQGGRREILRTTASEPVIELPAGTYYVRVRSGLYEKHDQIAVGAGQIVRREIVLDAARLRVSASLSVEDEDDAFPIVYRVFAEGHNGREVATSWDRTPSFTLPPGRYRILAQIGVGNVEAAKEVELAPGADVAIELAAQAAELRLRVAEGSGVIATNRFWEIRSPDGKIVWRTSQRTPRALLAPGLYQVRCEVRDRTFEETVELAAGQALIAKLGDK